jgi:hypothetical protein
MNALLKRLPKPQSILQVYAVIAVIFSAWTVTAFLWKLSAWLLLLNLGEIFTIFSYSMFVNLLESLLVLLLVLAVCALVPPSVLRDDFVVRGTILSLGVVGSMMALVRFHMEFGMDAGLRLLLAPLAVLLLTAILLVLAPKFRFLHSAVGWISDRLTVFLYILLPLFVALSAYIVFRNLT